jgi:hypothetical protein
MIIAERMLNYIVAGSDVGVAVRLFAPEFDGVSWVCRYQIDWPHGRRTGFAAGLDSVQALHLTMQKIGIDIYTSEYHATGRLAWEKQGAGYGFPVPKNARDVLVGDDREFEG